MLHLPFCGTQHPIYRNAFRAAGSLILVLFISLSAACAQDLDVPYEPSPPEVVDAMLDMARVDSTDYVIDLGSGDGRIVIAAAERGAAGHGVDLDPQRIREARNNARQAGMEHRVLFLQEDLFETDFSRASVLTMYLWPRVNIRLRPALLDVLRPGTRVISHSHDMNEWQPDATKVVRESDGSSARIYLWIIPAEAEGQWTWNIDESIYSMDVIQEYQEVEIQFRAGGKNIKAEHAALRGKRFTFTVDQSDANHVYSGYIQDDHISRIVQIREGERERVVIWSAQKQ